MNRLTFAAFGMLVSGFLLFSAVRTTPAVTSTPSSPYRQWSNGPSPGSNFFPIGVWLQSPRNVNEFKKIGINLFVGFYGNLDEVSLREMASARLGLLPPQNPVGLRAPLNMWIKGWDSYDEPDNAQSNGKGGYGPCISPKQVIAAYKGMKARDPSRPVLLNFGRGVADIRYVGRGSCRGETSYYQQAEQGGDIISFDIYPVAEYGGRLELVAKGLDNLSRWTGNRKIIWNFIEACPISGGSVPTAIQERAEVWMSLIHGSRGIIYFVHQFHPTFREDGIFNYPKVVRAVAHINAEVISLAPVLNSPTIQNDVTVVSSPSIVPVGMMEKQFGGSTYVFAVAMRNSSTTATFTAPGVRSGAASVIGEDRHLLICNGQFNDGFSGYAVHLYKFTAGTKDVEPCKSSNSP
jgi:hypothetical protein